MHQSRILSALIALFAAAALFAGAPAKAGNYRHFVLGDINGSTSGQVSGGLLLMGGGDRNIEAMRWFFAKAGNGHIVVLSASYGKEIGQEFYHNIGGIRSVETFVFRNRVAANDPKVLARLRHADGIFIAGGDQARYVRFWRGTPVAEILDAHVAAGKPIAGTSAGLAMLGEKVYGAMDGGSITSAEALADPFGSANTIESDFVHFALLKGVVTDTHFKERNRLGRLFAFLAKAQHNRNADQPSMIGLGVDESAALAVDPDGSGRIYATEADGSAWVVQGDKLRGFTPGGPLDAANVQVIGVGKGSVIHLPQGTVDNPVFRRNYAVRRGELVQIMDSAGLARLKEALATINGLGEPFVRPGTARQAWLQVPFRDRAYSKPRGIR